MPSTFGPGLAVDPVTLAPVPNALIRVMDTEGNVEYTTQDLQGTTQPVLTDHRGQYPQFQVPESVPAALLVSPPYMQRIASLEALQRALESADRAEAAAASAAAIRDGLETRVQNVEARLTALESAAGLGPSTPGDGQTP